MAQAPIRRPIYRLSLVIERIDQVNNNGAWKTEYTREVTSKRIRDSQVANDLFEQFGPACLAAQATNPRGY